MKAMMTLVIASTLVLSACGKKEERNSSGGGSNPAPKIGQDEVAKKGKADNKRLLEPVKPVDKQVDKSVAKPEKKNPKVAKKTVKTPSKSVVPPQKYNSEGYYSGIAETGAMAGNDYSYVSLVNDGLMNSIRKLVTTGNSTEERLNKDLAASLVNGKMYVNQATGEVHLTLKVREHGYIETYNYKVYPNGHSLVRMRLVNSGPYSVTTGRQNLKVALACMDVSYRCQVAMIRVQQGYGSTLQTNAYAILRRQVADIGFKLANSGTSNRDLLDIRQFIINSGVIYEGNNCLENAYLESFEVAYGISMVRTLLVGKNNELMAHTAPLVHRSGYSNWVMRPFEVDSEDMDRSDIYGRTFKMASTLSSATLKKVDGGKIVVAYRTRYQSNYGSDEMVMTYTAKPIPTASFNSLYY